MVLLAYLAYDWTANAPGAEKEQRVLENDFAHLSLPANSVPLPLKTSHKTHQASVSQSYESKLNYAELRAFYDQELAKNGWRFWKEQRLRDWGRDLGGMTADYCKRPFLASLQYAGEKADYGWNYALGLSWGLEPTFADGPERPCT